MSFEGEEVIGVIVTEGVLLFEVDEVTLVVLTVLVWILPDEFIWTTWCDEFEVLDEIEVSEQIESERLVFVEILFISVWNKDFKSFELILVKDCIEEVPVILLDLVFDFDLDRDLSLIELISFGVNNSKGLIVAGVLIFFSSEFFEFVGIISFWLDGVEFSLKGLFRTFVIDWARGELCLAKISDLSKGTVLEEVNSFFFVIESEFNEDEVCPIDSLVDFFSVLNPLNDWRGLKFSDAVATLLAVVEVDDDIFSEEELEKEEFIEEGSDCLAFLTDWGENIEVGREFREVSCVIEFFELRDIVSTADDFNNWDDGLVFVDGVLTFDLVWGQVWGVELEEVKPKEVLGVDVERIKGSPDFVLVRVPVLYLGVETERDMLIGIFETWILFAVGKISLVFLLDLSNSECISTFFCLKSSIDLDLAVDPGKREVGFLLIDVDFKVFSIGVFIFDALDLLDWSETEDVLTDSPILEGSVTIVSFDFIGVHLLWEEIEEVLLDIGIDLFKWSIFFSSFNKVDRGISVFPSSFVSLFRFFDLISFFSR